LIGFTEFCDGWVDFCIKINREGLDKGQRGKGIGAEFEKYFFENVLSSLKIQGQKFVSQRKIQGINYKWDFLLVDQNASDMFDMDASEILAVFEVKAHGAYGYKSVYHLRDVFDSVEKANPKIKLFYVTFRETDTYDRKDREIFGRHVQKYYRLSDSGDGVQLPPKTYFPDEWDRLIKDLSELKR
jgi:hypothetical protein